jgi:hypothetical protein
MSMPVPPLEAVDCPPRASQEYHARTDSDFSQNSAAGYGNTSYNR